MCGLSSRRFYGRLTTGRRLSTPVAIGPSEVLRNVVILPGTPGQDRRPVTSGDPHSAMSLTYADAHGDLIETLDGGLRAAVRAEGVDPQRDASLVRRLADRVVGDHDERSLTGAVAPVEDQEPVVDELVARVSGFGALQRYLDDPSVEEIWINDPSRVFVARNGRHELTNVILSKLEVQELVERMLKSSGRRIDLSQPFVDAMLPAGHRLHVVLEGISREFAAVNIRKFVLKAARLGDLVRLGSLPTGAARFLESAVLAGQNIVIAGGTQTGTERRYFAECCQ